MFYLRMIIVLLLGFKGGSVGNPFTSILVSMMYDVMGRYNKQKVFICIDYAKSSNTCVHDYTNEILLIS